MDIQEKRKYNLKSNLIIEYLCQFNYLEKIFISLFNEAIKELGIDVKSKLYFYDTCLRLKAGIFVDFENEILRMQNIPFNQEENFKNFSLKNIIKLITNNESFSNLFTEKIPSIQIKMVTYNILDLIVKFIDMRNILAHEIIDIKFKQGKSYLEPFSKETIVSFKFDWMDEADIVFVIEDENLNALYSNIIYIKKVLEKLDSKL